MLQQASFTAHELDVSLCFFFLNFFLLLSFSSLPSGRSSKSSSSSSEPTEYSDWLSEMSACHSETAHGGLSIGQAHSRPLCKVITQEEVSCEIPQFLPGLCDQNKKSFVINHKSRVLSLCCCGNNSQEEMKRGLLYLKPPGFSEESDMILRERCR